MGEERWGDAGTGSGMGAGSFIVSQCGGWSFCEFFERGRGSEDPLEEALGEYPCSWEGYGKDDCPSVSRDDCCEVDGCVDVSARGEVC